MSTTGAAADHAAPPAVGGCCDEGHAAGLDASAAAAAAVVLKALADPVRLRLYSRIPAAGHAVCVCDIQDVGVSQPTVSHHLRRLRDAGLIDCERRGTWVYYWRVPGAVEQAASAVGLQPRA